MKKILIMGLPGSGKTTLAEALTSNLIARNKTVCRLNADSVREIHNDWDFSVEGRLRQSKRMRRLADTATTDFVIADFIAPLPENREAFGADYLVWLDTINDSRFDDTNKLFVPPDNYNIVCHWQDAEEWAEFIADILC